jgi:hypothetical protein
VEWAGPVVVAGRADGRPVAEYTPTGRGDISYATDGIAEWVIGVIETPELADVVG